LRPLVKKGTGKNTAIMPRDHTIIVNPSGLVTITGGKWTTYRKMANDVINNAVFIAKLQKKLCVTEALKIHGWISAVDKTNPLHFYGSDAAAIKELINENGNWGRLIHPSLPNIQAEIIWAVRNEMAITIEDVLARRTRMLFLNAPAAITAAPLVAKLMAAEMNKDEAWMQQQINDFIAVAKQYVLS
jgi:glycerol-3-phosphate dehydrogenase